MQQKETNVAPLRPQPLNNKAGSSTCKKKAEGKKALHAETVSEQVQKLLHRRKRHVPLIMFTEKGNRMDSTPAFLKLEASELQIRTGTTIQNQTKKSIQLSSLPSATSNAQDRGTVLLQIGWICTFLPYILPVSNNTWLKDFPVASASVYLIALNELFQHEFILLFKPI